METRTFTHLDRPISTSIFEIDSEPTSDHFVVFGVPYDSTTSYRPGTRFGPQGIRVASFGLESYSPRLDRDLEDIHVADLGDLPFRYGPPEPILELLRETTRELVKHNLRPAMLGGEHSLTPGVVAALSEKYPSLTVVQLDAHCDLREHYLDQPNSHACAMRRCLDYGVDLLQWGIRSGPREEWEYVRGHGTYVTTTSLKERLLQGSGPLYVTLDIDVFDPSLVRGTGTPEPGGVTWDEFAQVIEVIRDSGRSVVGFDCVEVAPQLDPTQVSEVVGAKAVREMLLAFS